MNHDLEDEILSRINKKYKNSHKSIITGLEGSSYNNYQPNSIA